MNKRNRNEEQQNYLDYYQSGANNQNNSQFNDRVSQEQSEQKNKKKKQSQKVDMQEQAYQEIYQYYAQQHLKRGIVFEQIKEELQLTQAELISFCKDFGFAIVKKKIMDIYLEVSNNKKPLSFEQFKKALPLLAFEYSRAKTKEIKARLREIKFVLEYPENQPFIKLAESIEKAINDIKSSDSLPRQMRFKKQIQYSIRNDQYEDENVKTQFILDQIEKILKIKKLMSYQEIWDMSGRPPQLIKKQEQEFQTPNRKSNIIKKPQNNLEFKAQPEFEDNFENNMVQYKMEFQKSKQNPINEINQKKIIDVDDFLIQNLDQEIIHGQVMHPLYFEYFKLLDETLIIYDFEDNQQNLNIFLIHQIGINNSKNGKSYKDKIKKFQYAFNLFEPARSEIAQRQDQQILANEKESYKSLQPQKKPESIEQVNYYDKKIQEQREKERYNYEREKIRKIHEQIRVQKIENLKEQFEQSRSLKKRIDGSILSSKKQYQISKQFSHQSKLQERMKKEMIDYSVKSKQSIEELFKNKNLTFEDIENLEVQEVNRHQKSNKKTDFDPSDYIDLDNSVDDDEILNKFK